MIYQGKLRMEKIIIVMKIDEDEDTTGTHLNIRESNLHSCPWWRLFWHTTWCCSLFCGFQTSQKELVWEQTTKHGILVDPQQRNARNISTSATDKETRFAISYLDSKMIFPIVSQTLVELSVFILRDIIRISCPQRFGFVQLFLVNVLFL